MDGDAVCACKILQNLFKSDNTQYTLVPVAGKGELQQAFLDHMGQVKVVVLINCGGSLNILEHFEPDDDIEFFIIDSHRPLELDNIYNEDRVFVVINDKEELDFPQFDDVYGSDMESEDEYYSDEEDYDGEPNAKRSRAAVRLRCIWTFLMSL
jgi:cell division control protein 45